MNRPLRPLESQPRHATGWRAGFGLLIVLLSSCALTRPVRDTAARHLLDAAVPARATTASQPAVALAKPALPA